MPKDNYYSAQNPYVRPVAREQATIFAPNESEFNLIMLRLSSMAMRVLFYALTHMRTDGSVTISGPVMGAYLRIRKQSVSKGVCELVELGFLRRKAMGEYWVSPAVARAITIETR